MKSGIDYVFLGVENMLKKNLYKCPSCFTDETEYLNVSLNVDGLPLFKSSKNNLVRVFPVALSCGNSKPNDRNFLNDTIQEMKKLQDEGMVYRGRQVNILLTYVVCDAPARAMVKGIKQFSRYYGCERCIWLG